MNSPSLSSRRWIQLRHDLYEQVQKHVMALIGEGSPGLNRYQKEYEQELSKAWKVSSREKLLSAVQKARIVWLGDFHALQQSQKAHLRILKALPQVQIPNVLLGIECIEARHQAYLDRYLQGKMSDRDFLKAVEWKRSWGFPWEHYKPLFRWAIKNKVRIFALNLKTEKRSIGSLRVRDEFSGRKIAEILSEH
ncbi:MAG: ChaN family lipoprotein, partial [Pseudobdellovibrionaceae bacterium]